MTIDTRYIPAFSIDEGPMIDKDTGELLAGGKVYFEQDNQRGTPKTVYQITGTSPDYTFTALNNTPLVLSSIGTFEDSVGNPVVPYFYPYDDEGNVEYYYVKVYNSDDVFQFARESVPHLDTTANATISSAFQNELSNPQFAEVLFDTSTASHTYNFNAASLQVVTIAPDWDIIVSCVGVGTVTVAQIKPIGSLNRLTNAGTTLDISSTGLTRLRLRQRLYGSPNLWGSGYVSGTFIAKTYAASPSVLNLYYSQSNGTQTDKLISSATLLASGAFKAYPGTVQIDVSTSNQAFPDAYVDIEFDIPLSIQIGISSVMVVGTSTPFAAIEYDQTSWDRQIDHLFHYYQPLINFKPIPSLLTGWDFPLNPAQFGATYTVTGSAYYAWDQTIMARGTTNMAVARNSVTGGIQITTAATPDTFYMVQYLSGAQAKKMLGTRLSVNVNAFKGTVGSAVTCRVYLYRGSAAAVFPDLGAGLLIGSLAITGVFTVNTTAGQGLNWTLIPRGNMGQASGTLSTVTTASYANLNDAVDLAFNGWQITTAAEIADTDKFAIVVTFVAPTTGTIITVNSISVVPGDIPTRPAPQTPAEVLQECEYYYETSYNTGVAPGTATTSGAFNIQRVVGNDCVPLTFQVPYYVEKRAVPTSAYVGFYSVDGGAAGFVKAFARIAGGATTSVNVATSNWTFGSEGKDSCIMGAANSAALATRVGLTEAYITYNWLADARLGILP